MQAMLIEGHMCVCVYHVREYFDNQLTVYDASCLDTSELFFVKK